MGSSDRSLVRQARLLRDTVGWLGQDLAAYEANPQPDTSERARDRISRMRQLLATVEQEINEGDAQRLRELEEIRAAGMLPPRKD